MSLDEEVRRIIREELPDALRSLLGSASDRRDVPRLLPGKRVRNRTPKTKRNDGKCHFPNCPHPALRVYSMFCKETHGKMLSKADKRKYNEAWNKKHGK